MTNTSIFTLDFRAWHKKRKKMYDVLHLHMESEVWATVKGYSVIEQKDIHIAIQPNDCIILQYTGINDRNNRKIYNRDIVKVGDKIMEVVYDQGSFYTPSGPSNYRLGGWKKDKLQWLGNVYENPTLLNSISADERCQRNEAKF